MGTPPRDSANQQRPQSDTNPLGGRVHTPRYANPSHRHWSGYVAHVRTCPQCDWENDETALFCVSCSGDIRMVAAVASSNSRPGIALLQKRLQRERRQQDRTRPGDASGGGGWIAFGAVLVGITLVVAPEPTIRAFAWIAAVASALAGLWQIRRDYRAMRMWGSFLASCAALVLLFVGFRAIQASNAFVEPDDPAITASPASDAGTIAGAATPGVTISGNVPMYGGGPGHEGIMPGPAPSTSPTLAWQVDTGGELYSTPILADGILYVTSKSGVIRALDTSTGNELWQREITSYVTRASPAVIDGVVYVGGGFTFSALDAATGKELWTVPLQYGGHASPTIRDGLLVVSSQQGWIYALDVDTGATVWRLPTEGIVFGAATMTADALLYATDEGILYNVDPVAGTLNWRTILPGAIYATPVISGEMVLVPTQSGELHAVALISGDTIWSVDHGGAQPPAATGDIVVLTASDGGVYGLDAATGAQRWLYPTGKQSLTAPAIAGDSVIFGAGNSLLALDLASGEALWYYLAGDRIESPPIVAGRYVYFGGRDGFLYAVTDQ